MFAQQGYRLTTCSSECVSAVMTHECAGPSQYSFFKHLSFTVNMISFLHRTCKRKGLPCSFKCGPGEGSASGWTCGPVCNFAAKVSWQPFLLSSQHRARSPDQPVCNACLLDTSLSKPLPGLQLYPPASLPQGSGHSKPPVSTVHLHHCFCPPGPLTAYSG
jgi:hypothetical protein